VAAKWFADEEFSDKAVAILEGGNALHVPDLFFLEMDSIVLKWIARGIVSRGEGEKIHSALGRLPLIAHSAESLRSAAFDIAAGTGTSIYDSVYLSLAIARKSRLITSDNRLVSSLKGTGLEDYALALGLLAVPETGT